MPDNRARFLDDFARLMTDAAGVASGVRREAETALRGQLERLLRGMDVPGRDEFDELRERLERLRAENEDLGRRLGALEAGSAGEKH
jgi:BMFP domain-containing protein YqiC